MSGSTAPFILKNNIALFIGAVGFMIFAVMENRPHTWVSPFVGIVMMAFGAVIFGMPKRLVAVIAFALLAFDVGFLLI